MKPTGAVVLSRHDNVAVATSRRLAGDTLAGVTLAADIPSGHKFALRPIAANAAVLKYGEAIGFATAPIAAGDHVHTHNLGPSARAQRPDPAPAAPPAPHGPARSFMGYRRPDGQAGTRNYIGILTSVNCSATAAKAIAQAIGAQFDFASMPGIDGVAAFPHTTGCGMSDHGSGFELLKRTLAGYVGHPNFGGILMVGLGCEQFQIQRLVEECQLSVGTTFDTMTIRGEGGTRATVAAGVERISRMIPHVAAARRTAIPIAELSVALQCGGSDAYSGITANPALGPRDGPADRGRRHRDPDRNAGDLRRRASAGRPRPRHRRAGPAV